MVNGPKLFIISVLLFYPSVVQHQYCSIGVGPCVSKLDDLSLRVIIPLHLLPIFFKLLDITLHMR